jgi:hypothetical protein
MRWTFSILPKSVTVKKPSPENPELLPDSKVTFFDLDKVELIKH